MKIAALALISIAAFMASAEVKAAQAPTSEQLELLRELSPEQQQALLEAVATPPHEADAPPPATGGPVRRQPNDVRQRETPVEEGESTSLTLKPEDTILIEASIRQERERQLADAERSRLRQLLELIRSNNPFQLDRDASLNLPGVGPIALKGLTEEQATQRLSLEPSLLPLDVRVSRIPIAKSGIAGLKSFGYDFFDGAPTSFSPIANLPVPADYIVGADDQLNIQLYGALNRTHRLTVNREGSISFPELGPISVGGMSFDAARQTIQRRVEQQLIGVSANVSLSEIRAIRVIVSGEARFRGSYTVDGFATVITALYAAGGVTKIGSLRDIQLLRKGEVVRRLDLYDLLVRGDTSDDVRLMPGDVVFVPTIGPTVSVDGEVQRPAIYELRDEASVADVVRTAGGLTAEADRARVSLTYVEQSGRRVVVDVGLDDTAGAGHRVVNGAVLRISRLRPQIDAGIEVVGAVHRSGPRAWRQGLRLTQVIGSLDELTANADPHYVLIRRESPVNRYISYLSADLSAAIAAPGSDADPLLEPRDRLLVFDFGPARQGIIRNLLGELRERSSLARPDEIVEVGGEVKVPGTYPLEQDMRVSDLLRASGSLAPSAFDGTAELVRQVINSAGERRSELVSVDLAAIRRGDVTADVVLQPFDYLMIKETPEWGGQEHVTLRGEVRFPGTYVIQRGETLWQLLGRAGGLTALAFPEGSVFTRQDLKELEQQQLDRYGKQLREDLAALALQAANVGQSDAAQQLQSGRALLAELEQTEATGRFVIDLPGLLGTGSGSPKDVLLRGGDELIIPRQRQEVSVIGEVQNTASHLFEPGLTRSDYIQKSGGTTKKADRGRIYVIRADGSVAMPSGSLLARRYDVAIKAGDTIVVPMDTERMPRLPFWQAVTQILYNVAVSVAAINSF